jgi:mRNA interferase RelE/StbE
VAEYRVSIKPSAAKELEGVPSKKDRTRLVDAVLSLAADPRPPGCQKLSGSSKYRIRRGSYRVVYLIQDESRSVSVVKVGHRIDVYRD